MKKLTLPTLAIWALLLASSHVFAVDGKNYSEWCCD